MTLNPRKIKMPQAASPDTTAAGREGLHFEPHAGYGIVIDGDPMPFGYISEGYGKPIFELSPVLSYDADDLFVLAVQMSASRDMLTALQGLIRFRNWELAEGGVTPPDLIDVWKDAEAAIAKATAREARHG